MFVFNLRKHLLFFKSVENYDSLLMNRALSLGDDAANVKFSGKRQATKVLSQKI